jgi:hypothetical protein
MVSVCFRRNQIIIRFRATVPEIIDLPLLHALGPFQIVSKYFAELEENEFG